MRTLGMKGEPTLLERFINEADGKVYEALNDENDEDDNCCVGCAFWGATDQHQKACHDAPVCSRISEDLEVTDLIFVEVK